MGQNVYREVGSFRVVLGEPKHKLACSFRIIQALNPDQVLVGKDTFENVKLRERHGDLRFCSTGKPVRNDAVAPVGM